MKFSFSFQVLLIFILVSCGQTKEQKNPDEGKITGNTYVSEEIGWSIQIPEDWELTTKEVVEALDQKGKTALEDELGQDIDTKALKHLLGFQKDKFNNFSATSEPFTEEFPGEYQQANRQLNEIIFNAFKSKGIKADTSTGKVSIDGIDFNVLYSTIYAPDGTVILNQILYSKLINGFDFGVNINYNNPKDKETLTNAFYKSKFTQLNSTTN